MKTAVKNHLDVIDLRYLPGFASFILENHLDDFEQEQMRMSAELNFPLLRYFENIPKEKMLEVLRNSSVDLLTKLSANQASEHIESSQQRWLANQLPVINRHEIVAEDITLIHYMRKQTLAHFIPFYSANVVESVELMKEIDRYVLASETALTNAYMQLLKNDIRDQLHFNQKNRRHFTRDYLCLRSSGAAGDLQQ